MPMDFPTPFQRRTLWNAATGVSILVLGLLLVGLIWLTGRLFGFLQPVLIPVIVAGIVAYVLDPVVRLLQKRGISRLWAIVILYMAILTGATLLVANIVPGVQRGSHSIKLMFAENSAPAASPGAEAQDPADSVVEPVSGDGEQGHQLERALVRELRKLESANRDGLLSWLLVQTDSDGEVIKIPIQERDFESYSESRAGRFLYRYKDAIADKARNWITTGSTRVLGFLGLVLGMIMVPIYLFFFLKDSEAIRTHWHEYVPLKASRFKTELVETLQEINGYLVSFFRGQVLVAVIDGLLVGIALTAFGLPYGFIIGVFMAILGVIPYVGNILCLIPACLIAYLHAAQGNAIFNMQPVAYTGCVVAIFLLVQQINSLVTAPKIVGDSVGLHPMTVIFSMLFWSVVLGGFIGALLAVPFTAAIKVLFRRFIWVAKIQGDSEGAALERKPVPG